MLDSGQPLPRAVLLSVWCPAEGALPPFLEAQGPVPRLYSEESGNGPRSMAGHTPALMDCRAWSSTHLGPNTTMAVRTNLRQARI